MSIDINPRRLPLGPWAGGFALHIHTLSSTFIGHDEYGHARFETLRSPVGELLYQLKYRHDQTVVDQLAEAAGRFLKKWAPPIDAIVPVPPSVSRKPQPVLSVATAIGERLHIPLCTDCIVKVKQTPQLKDITEYDKRMEALKDAFTVSPENTTGKSLLLFDDLYGSGATVRYIVDALKDLGHAKAVYLLTLTTK